MRKLPALWKQSYSARSAICSELKPPPPPQFSTVAPTRRAPLQNRSTSTLEYCASAQHVFHHNAAPAWHPHGARWGGDCFYCGSTLVPVMRRAVLRPELGAETPICVDGSTFFHHAVTIDIDGAVAISAAILGSGDTAIEVNRVHAAINILRIGETTGAAARPRFSRRGLCH